MLCSDGAACGQSGRSHLRFIFAMPYPILLQALERLVAALARLD